MTGAAAARAAIGIDPADAGIGPGRRVELAVRQYLYCRSMALKTADHDRRRSSDNFAEEIVERGKNFSGAGVMAAFLLIDFALVAARAVLRRYDHGDRRTVVLEGIGVGFFRTMAVVAADALLGVSAIAPVLSQSGIERAMTLEASLVPLLVLLRKFLARRGLGRISGGRTETGQQRKPGKHC